MKFRTLFALSMVSVAGVALVVSCSGGGANTGDNDLGATDLSASDRTAGMFTRCQPATSPKIVSSLPGIHGIPRLGFTGSRLVVAWNTQVPVGPNTRYRIDYTLADKFGNVVGPNQSLTADPLADPGPPSVTPLIGGTVIAWTRKDWANQATNIVLNTINQDGERLNASGQPCDPSDFTCGLFQVTSSDAAREPFLARPTVDEHNGQPTQNQLGLVWVDSRNYPCAGPCFGFNDIYWKKVTGNGTTLVPDRAITASGLNRRNGFPRLAFDGVNQGVVWRDGSEGIVTSDFYFASLDGTGQVSAMPKKVGQGAGAVAFDSAPDIIWTGQEYGLVVANGTETQSSIVFQRFGSNGASVLQPTGITFDTLACTPAVAWDGDYYAVAWQTDCGNPGSDLAFELIDSQGMRIKPDGTACGTSVDPMCGVTLITNSGSQISSAPELLWLGDHSFAIAWAQAEATDAGISSQDIELVRVDCLQP